MKVAVEGTDKTVVKEKKKAAFDAIDELEKEVASAEKETQRKALKTEIEEKENLS
jgi:hypothetical protein